MAAADFSAQKQTVLQKAFADVVGVAVDQIIVDRVSDAVRVHLGIQSRDESEAAKVCGALSLDAINIKLSAQGLPKATLLEKPSIEHPGYCVLDFLTNTARIPLGTASELVPNFVRNGVTSRRKIFAMTEDDLRACGVLKEKQRQQIMVYIELGDAVSASINAPAAAAPVEPNEAYRNMKKVVSEIKTRTTLGVADETMVGYKFCMWNGIVHSSPTGT